MGIRILQIMGLSPRGEQMTSGLVVRPSAQRNYPDLFSDKAEPLPEFVQNTDELQLAHSQMEQAQRNYAAALARAPRVYASIVQEAPWSSGPCVFLALEDAEGQLIKSTLWSEEEIEENL